jgi:ssDNA-binding Zn-finger/Zn-ribbon topoisomerase 1
MGKLSKDKTVEICPKCGGELRRRSGKFGDFYGCMNYPNCRFTRNV